MAFNSLNFASIGNQSKRGKAPQRYTYRTADPLATVIGNNYFSTIASMLEINDIIEVEFVDSASTPTTRNGKTNVSIVVKVSGMIIAAEATANKRLLVATMADVSTASTQAVTSRVAGVITKITVVLGGAITLANSTMTFDIGGTAITGSGFNVNYTDSALGVAFTSSPTGARTVVAGSIITATSGGESTTAQPLYIIYEVTEDVTQSDDVVELTAYMADVTVASSAWVISPIAGTITSIKGVLYGAIGAADEPITAKIAGTAVTGGIATFTQAASAAGTVSSQAAPTALKTVIAGQAIELSSAGASTGNVPAAFTVVVTAN